MVKKNNFTRSNEVKNSRVIVKVYNHDTTSWMEIQRLYNKVQPAGYSDSKNSSLDRRNQD